MATDGTAPPADNIQEPPIPWDGDRMFNIYIYDYFLKRGFLKTAHEFMIEAAIPPQSQPPINARQGLLFEWWSVFWVLFTAKGSGNGPEDAMLYTQNAAQKQQTRTGQPGQQQVRHANGLRPPNPSAALPNGPPQQSGPMPNGNNSLPFPGNMNMSQQNGVPGSSSAPQGQNLPQLPPGQRQPVPLQQRGMNGVSFHSPTMAHSPPGGPNNPMGTNMGPIGSNPSLTQMSRGGMLPPNGPQGPMGQAQQTPQPAFQSLVGRSPSNPGSPAQNNLMAPSPSMSHRQPPGMVPITPEMLNAELNRIPPPTLQKLKQEMNIADKDVTALTIEEKHQIVSKFHRGNSNMNMKPPMAGPSNIPQPGPSPMQHPSRTPQMPPNSQQQGQPQQGPSQAQQQRGAKRNSTSPGQEPEQLPRNESSPPQSKRIRTGRSPPNADGPPPMTPIYPPHHQQQQHQHQQQHQQQQQQQQPPGMPPMQPPHMQSNGMRGPMQMPFSGPPMTGMNNPMLGHGIGTPQMNPPMNPAMMGAPAPGGMANNPQIHQYRQAMQTIHKQPPQLQQMQQMQQMLPGGVSSPSGSDVQGAMQGGPSPANRMGQNKPMTGMMPPPSPAMAAMAAKGPGGPPKPEDGSSANGRMDASPQNAATGINGPPSGQNAGTPVPTSTPAPHTPNATTMTAPSPSSILNSTPNLSNHAPPPSATDGLDPSFGFDLSAGLADFVNDPNLFTGESLNFERDFAAWFDPESAT